MIIFLDIDGVLNDHCALPSKYCGTKRECVLNFNAVLDAVPDAKIVVSSAWRYMILRGDVTLRGFEMLLLTHGVKCDGRIIGHTEADGKIEDEPSHFHPQAWSVAGLRWRKEQIYRWVKSSEIARFVVVDDLDLGMPEQVKIDGETGMTILDADEVISRLKKAKDTNPT